MATLNFLQRHTNIFIPNRANVDLSTLEVEKSHKLEVGLEDQTGTISLHICITGLVHPGARSDLTMHTDDIDAVEEKKQEYRLTKTPSKINEIGWLQVCCTLH